MVKQQTRLDTDDCLCVMHDKLFCETARPQAFSYIMHTHTGLAERRHNFLHSIGVVREYTVDEFYQCCIAHITQLAHDALSIGTHGAIGPASPTVFMNRIKLIA